MRQNAAEPCISNIAFPNVLMPVEPRAERLFGVVGVDHTDVAQAKEAFGLADGVLGRQRWRC